MLRKLLLPTATSLAISSCTDGGDITPPDSAVAALEGHLVIGHEVRSFTPCGSYSVYWVADETGGSLREVYESLASEPYQAIFAVLQGSRGPAPMDGFGADYDEQFTVTGLVRAENEGFGCDLDLSGVTLRARGNEPFWTLDVRESGTMVLSEPGTEPRELPLETSASGARRYSAGAGDQRIEVTVREEPCRDSMSGNFFSLSATVEIGPRSLTGCALETP